jgi:GT2 family glycosyltransferase
MAIRKARGKYVIRMDAHAEYPSDYVKNCIEELERTGADNVGGRLITKPGNDSITARAIACLTQNPIAVGNSKFRTGGGGQYVDTVPFGAYRRDVFDRIGLFREDLVRHQDYEFNARLVHAGGKIFLSSKIYTTYYNVPTFTGFIRQAYLNGIWCARAWIRYPASFCPRHAAPLAFFCWVLLSALLCTTLKPILWVTIVSLILYMAASLVAGLQTAKSHGWHYVFVVPPLIFSYHFIYGASTVAGFLAVFLNKVRLSEGGRSFRT